MCRQWSDAMCPERVTKHVAGLPRVSDRVPSRDDIPRVVNVVTTFHLIPQERLTSGRHKGKRRYHLPLATLALKLPPVKFSPKSFASVILCVCDYSTDFTALIFKSGKVVVVHTLSRSHSLVASQMVRLILSNIKVVIVDRKTGKLKVTFLEPYLSFKNRRMRNFVLSGQLGNRIDLQALKDAAPSIVSWSPGGFPGAEVTLRIKQESKCTCDPKEKIKCGCKVKMLIFTEGACVITGAISVKDGNRVFYLFKNIAPKFDDTRAPVSRDKRYASRLAEMLNRVGEPVAVSLGTPGANEKDNENDQEDAQVMDLVIGQAMNLSLGTNPDADNIVEVENEDNNNNNNDNADNDDNVPALFKAAKQGQLQLVRGMLVMGLQNVWARNNQGQHVLDILEHAMQTDETMQTVVHQEIVNVLRTYMTQHPE